jgi:hypothetical protein
MKEQIEKQVEKETRYSSKWLNDLMEVYAVGGDWEDMMEVLRDVDLVLVETLASTDSWGLFDKVKKVLMYD